MMIQIERIRRKKKRVMFKFSAVKQNLDFIISFVDSNPEYNKYYLMLREMRQHVAK
jgi:nucleoside-triphosphatase THEP1